MDLDLLHALTLADVLREHRRSRPGGTAVVCDVTSADSVADLAAQVGDRLDVLVNNAGGAFGASPVAEAHSEDWRAMYDVNVIGLMQVTRALLPALLASGAGTIVNVGSTAGRIAYEGGAGYTAAKHGTKVVTETLRLELWDQPVRVMEIAPGRVRRALPRQRDRPACEEAAHGLLVFPVFLHVRAQNLAHHPRHAAVALGRMHAHPGGGPLVQRYGHVLHEGRPIRARNNTRSSCLFR